MSLFAAIREILDTDIIVAGYVTADDDGEAVSKIRRQKLAEVDRLPAIILEVESDTAVRDLQSPTRCGEARLRVVCADHDSTAASDLAEAVAAILDGFRGTHAGLTLDPVTWDETEYQIEVADDDSDEADWFLEMPVFEVWYRAA